MWLQKFSVKKANSTCVPLRISPADLLGVGEHFVCWPQSCCYRVCYKLDVISL